MCRGKMFHDVYTGYASCAGVCDLILHWPASGSDVHSTPVVTESFVTYKLLGTSESVQIPLDKVVKCVCVMS